MLFTTGQRVIVSEGSSPEWEADFAEHDGPVDRVYRDGDVHTTTVLNEHLRPADQG